MFSIIGFDPDDEGLEVLKRWCGETFRLSIILMPDGEWPRQARS